MTTDILVVDDEDDIRSLISEILTDEGFHCRTAGDSAEALSAIAEKRPGLVVLDIWLEASELDGMEMLQKLEASTALMPIIMISGHGNIETAVNSIKLGAYDFIEKPFKADRLILTIRRALEASRLHMENSELRRRIGHSAEMVCVSNSMKQLQSALEKVAPTDSRILISGPAGVGKEVFARQLHAHSNRSGGPFIVLNCAGMNPDRMEIELFGEERQNGITRRGTLEEADGGTLLLDEVSYMPLEAQGKFVRVLQDQTFNRVGGEQLIQVDVRVIASTNQDMQAEMTAGNFRQDLFYRLNVVPIQIQPLKERPDDIPVLVQHFMQRSADLSGVTARQISAEAMAVLQAHEWPGNVRQLQNAVEWILIMAPGQTGDSVSVENLPPDVGKGETGELGWEEGAKIMALPLREARENFERQYLLAQVSRFGGNVSRTAEFIGMERSALHRKLKILGLGASNITESPDAIIAG